VNCYASPGAASGKDIVVVDKSHIRRGRPRALRAASIRNNYFQPAMRRLMAHSVSVWDSDPKAFSYHPVGYMQISPEVMHEQVASIAQQQRRSATNQSSSKVRRNRPPT